MERRHNTRHAAALAAAAAAASAGSDKEKDKDFTSPSTSPTTATTSNLSPARLASKREMYESFQSWALKTYGDSAKTKTVTRRKYTRILKILKGEEQTNAENSKFRFWVKAKGFRIGPPSDQHEVRQPDQVLYVPCSKVVKNNPLHPKLLGSCPVDSPSSPGVAEDASSKNNWFEAAKPPPVEKKTGPENEDTVYKKVAVVENFFDIIYGVHVEMDGRGGKHAGQKRTYKAIAETYAFLPREAVTHFLMSCADCQKRMHLAGEGSCSSGACGAKGGHHGNGDGVQRDESAGSSSPETQGDEAVSEPLEIDYSLPITTTYLKHMRSLGYSEEDALNPDRERDELELTLKLAPPKQDSEDVDSEVSEEAATSGQESSNYSSAIPNHCQTEDVGDDGDTQATSDEQNASEVEVPLDMSNIKHENGHMHWTSEEPINMTKGDYSRSHQDHSYDRAMSPYMGCVKREASATPDDLSGGTKDEDDDDDDDDSDKIDINQYDPERLKAFNMFVRLFVDENLDRMVPISRQPKDKIQAIIDSCARQFPEFAERSRKRIRTYLKSCRRNKRTRDQNGWDMVRTVTDRTRAPHPHLTSALAEQILATACENESQNAKRMRLGLKPLSAEVERGRATSQLVQLGTDPEKGRGTPSRTTSHHDILQTTLRHGRAAVSLSSNSGASTSSTTLTYSATSAIMVNGTVYTQPSPSAYAGSTTFRQHVPNSTNQNSSSSPISPASNNGHPLLTHGTGGPVTNGPTDLSVRKSPNNTKYSLNPSEAAAVKQLIAGYRESAAFLLRSADELEMLLHQQN